LDVTYEQRKRRRRKRRRFRLGRLLFITALLISGAVWLFTRLTATHEGSVSAPKPDPIVLSKVQEDVALLTWVDANLLPVNEYSRPGDKLEEINAIVIHYVGNPGTTAKQNRTYYSRLAENHENYISSNFLVGLEGEIIECVPVDEVAFCSNTRNNDTISIECCHPDETGKFNDDTYDSLVKLTAWLCNELGLDSSDLLRHYDITKKECPKYFVDHEDAWEDFKADVQEELESLQNAELAATPAES
jgi:N-acetylmuramoyl-L-alanine amidase CwlA